MDFVVGCLAVFAITLTVTKSKIFACKREFVEKRYDSSWTGQQRPSFIHTWWHAMFTCPMCLGFWVSLCVAPWVHVIFYPIDALALFGANWLLHCLEASLFEVGNFFQKEVDTSEE